MKHRLLCILLILSMAFTIMPVFGASASGGGGASSGASAYQYGVIYEVDDYHASEGFVEVTILFPQRDSFINEIETLSVTLDTCFNDRTYYNSMDSLYDALPVGIPIRFIAEECDNENYGLTSITDLWIDMTPTTYDPYNTYDPVTGFYAPSNSRHLPVYWKDEGDNYVDFYPVYLDENHYYSVEAYDYGLFVRGMWAIEEEYTVDLVWLYNAPEGDFDASFTLYAYPFPSNWIEPYIYSGCLKAELVDSSNKIIDTQYTEFSDEDYLAVLTFSDLPDQNAIYTIRTSVVQDRTSNKLLSPIYNFAYNQREFLIGEGTVTEIVDISSFYQDLLEITISTDDGPEWITCELPTWVDDVYYTEAAELESALRGKKILYASGDNTAFSLNTSPPIPEPDTYGLVKNAYVSGGMAIVRILFDDGTNKEHLVSDTLIEDVGDLSEWCKDLIGTCGKFAIDESGNDPVVVDMDLDYTGTSYENKRYLSSGKFEGQKELPVYYYADGKYQAPVVDGESILNEDAIYNITVYDHGIIITDMKYAEIDVLTIVPETNLNFTQDIVATYGIWEEEESNITLNIQLLDDRGKLLEEQSTKVDNSDTAEPYLYFRNYPNENLTYHIKAWITDENGKRISPIYTEADLGIENIKNGVKTTEQAISRWIIQSVEKKNSSVELSIKWTTPTLQESKTLSCNAYTNINGKTYSSMDELAGLFKEGMLIEYADNYVYQKVIRFSTEKQQVVTDASYDETKNEVTATVTLVSNDAAKDDESVVTGVVYAGVYSKNGILKGITTIPATQLKADGTANNVSVTVEGIAYEAGDYIKAFFWNGDNNAAISNAATAKITQ